MSSLKRLGDSVDLLAAPLSEGGDSEGAVEAVERERGNSLDLLAKELLANVLSLPRRHLHQSSREIGPRGESPEGK
jgi:hypothetical protein